MLQVIMLELMCMLRMESRQLQIYKDSMGISPCFPFFLFLILAWITAPTSTTSKVTATATPITDRETTRGSTALR